MIDEIVEYTWIPLTGKASARTTSPSLDNRRSVNPGEQQLEDFCHVLGCTPSRELMSKLSQKLNLMLTLEDFSE